MFKIIDNPEFTHEVKVMVPVDGGHEEQTFRARFRLVDEGEVDPLKARTAEEFVAFLKRAIVGLEDLVDAAGKPLPYSDALRDRLIALPFIRVALTRTYLAAVTKAREGN